MPIRTFEIDLTDKSSKADKINWQKTDLPLNTS